MCLETWNYFYNDAIELLKEILYNNISRSITSFFANYRLYLVRQDRFEGSAEVSKVVSAFVHLHALAIVLDLR